MQDSFWVSYGVVWTMGEHQYQLSRPQTLNPKLSRPQTLNPKPQTLHPKPQTLHPRERPPLKFPRRSILERFRGISELGSYNVGFSDSGLVLVGDLLCR